MEGSLSLFLKILFIYLREIEKRRGEQGEEGEGEAESPLSREPDAGLDPRTLGPRLELKADAQPSEPLRHPNSCFLFEDDVFLGSPVVE